MDDLVLVFERLAQLAGEAGARAALETLERDKELRRDRRLRNTKFLLKKYRMLKLHQLESVSSEGQLYENVVASALEILYDLDEQDNEGLYIESIQRSQKRTEIIMEHIDHMLHMYKVICEGSKTPKEDMRRYRVLHAMYIAPSLCDVSAAEVAAQEHIAVRTLYKDLDRATADLSALLFGVDGLRLAK